MIRSCLVVRSKLPIVTGDFIFLEYISESLYPTQWSRKVKNIGGGGGGGHIKFLEFYNLF